MSKFKFTIERLIRVIEKDEKTLTTAQARRESLINELKEHINKEEEYIEYLKTAINEAKKALAILTSASNFNSDVKDIINE